MITTKPTKKTNNPYDLKEFDKMNAECEHCGENLIREPGFYIGAMYISYALMVGLTVVFFVGLVVIMDYPIYPVLTALIISFLVLLPVSFRWARLIWINIFVSYKEEKVGK